MQSVLEIELDKIQIDRGFKLAKYMKLASIHENQQ